MKNKVNNFHCMCEAWFIWGAFLWLMAATYLCVDVLTPPVEHEHMFRIAPLYLLAIGFTLYMVVLLNDGRIVKNRSSFVFSLYSISIVVMLLLYENQHRHNDRAGAICDRGHLLVHHDVDAVGPPKDGGGAWVLLVCDWLSGLLGNICDHL